MSVPKDLANRVASHWSLEGVFGDVYHNPPRRKLLEKHYPPTQKKIQTKIENEGVFYFFFLDLKKGLSNSIPPSLSAPEASRGVAVSVDISYRESLP